jgi:hypothetical protein
MVRGISTTLRCLILTCALLASGSVGAQPRPEPAVRTISLTRVVRIPVTTQRPQDVGQTAKPNVETLLLSPGAPDELPEGPNGFDVLDDGSFLITDPLRQRIAVIGPQGTFHQEWKLGFAADSVTVIPNGLVLVREASTGQLHGFDRQGQPRPADRAALPEPAATRLLTAKSGSVTRPGGAAIEVQFERPGLRLLSLESLPTDTGGNTYVALEATAGGEATEGINVNKYIRKYSADGKLVAEIADIPLDYYVRPVDELRVRKGIVYQLMTANSEVRINAWDTN